MAVNILTEHFDIVIVGAGPGGTACALALAKSGLKVALVEKGTFPRDKTCGDAIPSPIIKVLKKVLPEVNILEFENKQLITSCSIYVPSGNGIHINWYSEAFNSTRLDFDNYLFELVKTHTNTTIFENCSIKQILNDKVLNLSSRDGEVQLTADLVIGCDGANSVVAKSFGISTQNTDKRLMAVRAYYKKVECKAECNEFFLLPNNQGYFWIFPVGNGLYNVGLGGMKSTKSADKQDLRTLFFECISAHKQLKEKFINAERISTVEGFRLPYGGKKNVISGERFMLVGDAAKLVDPLQGHGIDKSMYSGMLAAEQAIRCFKVNDFSASFINDYDNKVYKKYGKELQLNLMRMKLLYKFPWLAELFAGISKINWVNRLIERSF